MITKKNSKKTQNKNKRQAEEILRLQIACAELEKELIDAKYRLEGYDGIMKFIAKDLGEKFGIMLREEKHNCRCL